MNSLPIIDRILDLTLFESGERTLVRSVMIAQAEPQVGGGTRLILRTGHSAFVRETVDELQAHYKELSGE